MPEFQDRLTAALEGRYRVEQELGAGGMAIVYLAHDIRNNRKVALKVLRPELAAVLGVDRFTREIDVTANLQHAHILPLFESGEADGFVYYVMPFVEGESLREKLAREGPLPIDDVVRLLGQVADALHYAHSRGVLHRDIKPDNIMIAGRQATVMDFGVSRAVTEATEESALTTAGMAIGTPAYMAPEQAAADPNIDHRADIYALGIMGYELLTGATPFEGRAPHQVLAAHMTEDPGPVSGKRADTPEVLGDVIMRSLAKDPNARWSSAEDVVDQLESSVAAPPSAASPMPNALAGRIIPLAVVAAAAAIAIAVLAPFGEPAADVSPTSLVIFPFAVQGTTDSTSLDGEGWMRLLSASLDGAGDLRVVDPHAVVASVAERGVQAVAPVAGASLAEEFGAGLHVIGDVVRAGSQVRVGAALYRHGEPDPIGRASVDGDPEAIVTIVDSVAATLLASSALAGSRINQVAVRTSASLPAIKSWLLGESYFRRGLYPEAVGAFRAAVATDSQFALAHYRLSIAAEYTNPGPDVVEAAADAAVRLIDRLSARDSLLLVALLMTRAGDDSSAAAVFQSVTSQWPQDLEASFQLGEIDFHFGPFRGRPLSAARNAFERVVALDPNHFQALVHLNRIAAWENDTAALDSITGRLAMLGPEANQTFDAQVQRASALGDSAGLARLLGHYRTRSEVPMAFTAVDMMIWSKQLAASDSLFAIMAEPDRSPAMRAVGHLFRAYHRAYRGRWRVAKSELAEAQRYDPALGITHRVIFAQALWAVTPSTEYEVLREDLLRWTPITGSPALQTCQFNFDYARYPLVREYGLGLVAARLGDAQRVADAQSALASLEETAAVAVALSRSLEAHLAWQSGDVGATLQVLERQPSMGYYQAGMCSPIVGRPGDRYLRALALEAIGGRDDEAAQWFRSLANASHFDRLFTAPAELALGRIAERQARVNDARDHYQQFLLLWDDPDPELRSFVDEAEEALRRLG